MLKYCLFLLAVAGMAACTGKDTAPDPQTAGTGGAATLRITVKHHSRLIDSCKVYIKYNASNLPGSFDDSARVTAGSLDTVATFAGLKAGTYYLYGYGWDRLIADTVTGGAPYTISSEVSQNVALYVTEGD